MDRLKNGVSGKIIMGDFEMLVAADILILVCNLGCAQNNANMLGTMHTCSELCTYTQNYACMFRTMHTCSELCRHVQNYASMLKTYKKDVPLPIPSVSKFPTEI